MDKIVVLQNEVSTLGTQSADTASWQGDVDYDVIGAVITSADTAGVIVPELVHDEITATLKIGDVDVIAESKRVPVEALNQLLKLGTFPPIHIPKGQIIQFNTKHTLPTTTPRNAAPIVTKITLFLTKSEG